MTHRTHLAIRDPFRRRPQSVLPSLWQSFPSSSFFRQPDPFRQFSQLSGSSLPINIYETDEAIGLEAWLPGFSEEEISVRVQSGRLYIEAQSAQQSEAEHEDDDQPAAKTYRRIEQQQQVVSRSFALSDRVDPAAIRASLANGVLTVTLPKPAAPQAQAIPIQTVPTVAAGGADPAAN